MSKISQGIKKVISIEKKNGADVKDIQQLEKFIKSGLETEMYDDMEILTDRSLKQLDKLMSKLDTGPRDGVAQAIEKRPRLIRHDIRVLTMNIFQELKERKVLDKDGKVDALGPYGKSKLTGQEVAQYFKKHKVKDKKIRKAVEVALDLGGAMSVAQKEIKKFFGNSVLKNKDVQKALKYANESFEMNQLVGMLHEHVLNLTEKNLIPDIQKIVDTKGAAKVGGVMIDMFTASMIAQIYDKVNDQNKKKMEKAKIEMLVKIAQKMMQKMEYNPLDEGFKSVQ